MFLSRARTSAFPLLLLIAGLALPGLAGAETLSRIAFGSCAGEDQPQPIWEAVLAESPQLWIWAGDNIYADTEDMQVLRDKYGELRAKPGYQELLATGIPMLATWDDHDFGVNDGGADYPKREASQQVFLDFFGVPDDDPRRAREGVYHAEIRGQEGQRVQVIMLDTRYHRSPLRAYPQDDPADDRVYWPNPDPEATILGEAQWTWLKRQLLKPAELRLIVSSIQVLSSEHRFEKWMNFPRERRRLLDLLEETQALGVVLLSGDRHLAELSKMDRPGLYPLFDLTSSGLNKSVPRPEYDISAPEPNRYRVGRPFRGHHFGLVEVDWAQPDPMVRLAIVDQAGQRPIEQAIPLSTLSAEPASGAALAEQDEADRPARVDPDIRVDGRMDDWDHGDLVSVAGEHLYLRFATPDATTLTRSPSSIHVLLDFDGDATGSDHFLEPGTDLEIVFSPRREPGERGWRPVIQSFDPEPNALTAEDLMLAVAPTHASRWFELRLSRAALADRLPAAAAGGLAGMAFFAEHTESGALTVLGQESVRLPELRQRPSSDRAAATFPEPVDGGLRVVTLNTLWGSQLDKPDPFGRVLRALGADVFLFQEWSRDRLTEAQVERWFREHVDANVDWQAMVSGTADSWSGTLLVTRHPIRGRVPRTTPIDAGGWSFPARFAAAVVETPLGDVLAGSVHLKASGAIDTPEDERRFAEADAINRILVGMKSVAGPAHVVLGGDFNLLGDPGVLDRATRMLDEDGSPLTIIDAPVLGDPELVYTFGRERPRSRLDYLAYSDHSLRAINAFVLDTRNLDRASLRAHGLEYDDSAASDHLPVVVDLVPWPSLSQ